VKFDTDWHRCDYVSATAGKTAALLQGSATRSITSAGHGSSFSADGGQSVSERFYILTATVSTKSATKYLLRHSAVFRAVSSTTK
jgi:hypothetical protein